MKKYLSLFVIALIVLAIPLTTTFLNHQQTTVNHAAGDANTNITLNANILGNKINPSFDSFVGDAVTIGNDACAFYKLVNSNRANAMVNLVNNVGPGIIRMGDYHDYLPWNPNGIGCNGKEINKPIVDAVFNWAKRTNHKIIWTLRFSKFDPQTSANEAKYVAQVAGSTLYAFEFGNEPELYVGEKFRQQGWGYSNFKQEWEAYYIAVKAVVPNAKFSGPSTCCDYDAWFFPFMKDEASKIIIATDHKYEFNPNINPSPDVMLGSKVYTRFMGQIQPVVKAAHTAGLPIQFDEFNSLVSTNEPVGQTFAETLWIADNMLGALQLSADGIDVYGELPPDGTSPINTDATPRMPYYGMLFTHLAAPHGNLIATQINTPLNITSYASIGQYGRLRLAVLNKDLSKSTTVNINTTKSFSSASAIILTAPSIYSKTNVTLGGSQVNNDGTWAPTQTIPVGVSGATSQVKVPAATAILITYQP